MLGPAGGHYVCFRLGPSFANASKTWEHSLGDVDLEFALHGRAKLTGITLCDCYNTSIRSPMKNLLSLSLACSLLLWPKSMGADAALMADSKKVSVVEYLYPEHHRLRPAKHLPG